MALVVEEEVALVVVEVVEADQVEVAVEARVAEVEVG